MQGKYVLLGLVLLVGGYDLFNNVATQASSQVPDEVGLVYPSAEQRL